MISFPDPDNSAVAKESEQLQTAKPYPDLTSAGRELAVRLDFCRNYDKVVVLGIILGGLPVANEIASRLQAPLDVVIIRRLLAPEGPGSQRCGVSVAGTMIVDKDLQPPASPSSPLEHFLHDAITELTMRERTCRRGQPPLELSDKTVVLVDCGIRTGSTMRAAIQALRTLGPARILAAVPITSIGGHTAVLPDADEFVCLAEPRTFGNVGMWYKDFTRPGDDRVGEFVRSE